MNIVKNIDQYHENHVIFCDPIKNNVMTDGNFIRIIYSTEYVSIYGIYLMLPFCDVTCDKYYLKYRCNFNVAKNKKIIDSIKTIEESLLKKYEIAEKTPQLKIYEQLQNGNIKLFCDIGNRQAVTFILKISGIWETQFNYGLTYKFLTETL